MMAVHAQYPSNVLLLNSKKGQEGHDCSLQPQPGGFIEQSQMLFNNGGTNPLKRGREATTTTNIGTGHKSSPYNINQSSQFIDLTQLHNQPQQNVVSTGLHLSFGDQQQQQKQQFHNHHHQQQQQQHLSLFFQGLSSQIKQQSDEINQLLQTQEEQLRRGLAEKRQRHYRSLLIAAEESVSHRLREKEAEMEKAKRRNAELEARAAQLSMESQLWQAKAKEQEATAASLQAQLQRAIMSGGDGGLSEDAESAYVDPERVVEVGPTRECKGCWKRVASVVVLPCRHLCVCTECDAQFRACPVCLTLKNSSVQVYLS
ncbi:BOI-related E3 ubiquitin-protein ligase 1-like [Lotus japonicus]|uniref:BOI-related E3 ubiquitin-protein ligase 1-like n=1 Tax=Lotus japonicus TaxID=34305 RepID=UPI00258D4FBA|nr:BOI-related E3 ubiquitin-protein ligase 1-like [Lotus japonicus]